MTVRVEKRGFVSTVILARPERRNAIDRQTADSLTRAFEAFDRDGESRVAVLWGEGGTFCAGADLRALAEGTTNRLEPEGDGPLGPTRMVLTKPVVAAIEGHAVAGGLELALFCDLRVAAEGAILGVFCRRFGVPLVDGGTVRLPRIIGHARAMDMILTGRPVDAREALSFGLVNRVVPNGGAREGAEQLAAEIAALPQTCMRNDRRSVYEQWGMTERAALAREFELGMQTIASGETASGALRFADGAGRHGRNM